jgi:branched-chain amino acid transport system ATP-binding protein
MSSLELRDLCVERGGRPVVKDVTITVPAGQVTALLGPNGAGKSSLVLAVGGVLRPRPGSVSLDGAELAGRRPEKIRAAGVAIVPEGRRLLPDLTVDDNIKVATYALTRDAAAAGRARALELFPALERRLSVPARSLSGGEQQMVVLAQALVSQPKYILIDELSLGLAPVVVQRIYGMLPQILATGLTVLLVEQDVSQALRVASHLQCLLEGHTTLEGRPSDVTAEQVEAAYFGLAGTAAARPPGDAAGEGPGEGPGPESEGLWPG